MKNRVYSPKTVAHLLRLLSRLDPRLSVLSYDDLPLEVTVYNEDDYHAVVFDHGDDPDDEEE